MQNLKHSSIGDLKRVQKTLGLVLEMVRETPVSSKKLKHLNFIIFIRVIYKVDVQQGSAG
jgi:hypothetical protein